MAESFSLFGGRKMARGAAKKGETPPVSLNRREELVLPSMFLCAICSIESVFVFLAFSRELFLCSTETQKRQRGDVSIHAVFEIDMVPQMGPKSTLKIRRR